MTWKVGREAVISLGGARAVLMQLAHPLVAEGVSTHSNYLTDPFGRTMRTFMLGQMLTFGPTHVARQAARTINRLHTHVHGTLPAEAGGHGAGSSYHAHDPELLLWVHATLIDTILLVYPMFVGPLSQAEQEEYYQESKRLVRLLGLSANQMPARVQDLREYVQAMAYSDKLAATPQARQLAHQVLFPPVPSLLRPALHLNLHLTCELLPAPIREIYGLEWSPGPVHRKVFDFSTRSIRAIISRSPEAWRVFPVTTKMMAQEEVA